MNSGPRSIPQPARLPLVTTIVVVTIALVCLSPALLPSANAEQLMAGVARVDITREEAGPVNDRLFAKALVLKSGDTMAAIVTIDAVALAEIGSIRNSYMATVKAQLQKDLRINPANVIINASHCHGVVCSDIEARTVQAVRKAAARLVPVKVGAGKGHENRIQTNRRLFLKSGKEIDVRHAYSMPADDEVSGVGPIDPEIGVLRFDHLDGRTFAVVYNFAVHPIQGVPSGGNSADLIGFASKVIEENLSQGTMAFFLQGCAGDINPVLYKDVAHPRDTEPLGNLLGLSTLRAVRKIRTKNDDRLVVVNETVPLPRADLAQRIISLEAEQQRLLGTLRGTHLNLKTFLPLAVKYNLSKEFPSYYSHRYMQDKKLGHSHWNKLDATNRQRMKQYIRNIHTMEQLTRIQTNLTLLRSHQARNLAAGKRTIDAELIGLRIGDFVMTTFPGELTVQIGLNIKKASPHKPTFVAGYTNGYLYYAPTAKQLRNVGGAQEDSECLLAPRWQMLYEKKAAALLKKL